MTKRPLRWASPTNMDTRTLDQRCWTISCSLDHVRLLCRRHGHQARESTEQETWVNLGCNLGESEGDSTTQMWTTMIHDDLGWAWRWQGPPPPSTSCSLYGQRSSSGWIQRKYNEGYSGGVSNCMSVSAWLNPRDPHSFLEHNKAVKWWSSPRQRAVR
jgi:hypothetical protein